MNHLHLVASSDAAPSREIARDSTSAAQPRLHLVAGTGSLHRPSVVAIASPRGPGLLAAVLRVAILASAGIVLVTRGNMPAPVPAFEADGLAVPAGDMGTADAFMAAAYGRQAAPTPRLDPRWKEM